MTERDARQSRIDNLAKDALRLAESMPDMKSIIDVEMKSLHQDWQCLNDELKGFKEDLDDTKDSETLKDDLVNLEKWIESNGVIFVDAEGSSLDDIEEMLRQQDDFEKSIAVQEWHFQSTLGRLSKYTEKVESKYAKRSSINDLRRSIDKVDGKGNKSLFDEEIKSEKYSNYDKDDSVLNPQANVTYQSNGREIQSNNAKDGAIENMGKSPFQNGTIVEVTEEKIESSRPKRIRTDGRSIDVYDADESGNISGQFGKAGMDLEEALRQPSEEDQVTKGQITRTQERISRDARRENGSEKPSAIIDVQSPSKIDDGKDPSTSFKNDQQSFNEVMQGNRVFKELQVNDRLAKNSVDESHPQEHVFRDSYKTVRMDNAKDSHHATKLSTSDEPDMSYVTDESIIPAQVMVTEASMDFSFFDDDDHDYSDETSRSTIEMEITERDIIATPSTQVTKDGIHKELQLAINEEVNNNERSETEDLPAYEGEDRNDANSNNEGRISDSRLQQSDAFKDIGKNGMDETVASFEDSFDPSLAKQVEFIHHNLPDVQIVKRSSASQSDEELGPSLDFEAGIESDDVDIKWADEFEENYVDDSTQEFSKHGLQEEKGHVLNRPGFNEEENGKNRSPQQIHHHYDDKMDKLTDVTPVRPLPSILVSRPSTTEEEIKEQPDRGNFAKLDFAGSLEFKQDIAPGRRKSPFRKWTDFYVVILGKLLFFYDSEESFKRAAPAKQELNLEGAMISVEPGYSSSILRLTASNNSEFLVRCEDEDVIDDFLMAVSESAEINCNEDTISLPPAPPPPEIQQDLADKNFITSDGLGSSTTETSKSSIPQPELSSEGMPFSLFCV